MNYIFQNYLNRLIRNSFIILVLLGSSFIGSSQCVLSSSDDTQAEVLDCLTACGCSTVQIPNGVSIAMNGDWDLTIAGDITLEVLGSGSLEFSGNGGSAEGLILSENSVLVIGDPTNTNAIVQSGGNGQIRLTIGSTNFTGNDFAEIIEAGGADQNGPLPIELLSFDVMKTGSKAQILWTTLSEISLSHFEIEWSLDGKDFNSITSIVPLSTDATLKSYSFTTENLNHGSQYFRLVSVDLDGTKQFYSIKSVYISDSNSLNIFPNPTIKGEKLQVVSTQPIHDIELIDISGRVITTLSENDSKSYSLETDQLTPGLYILKLQFGQNFLITRVYVK